MFNRAHHIRIATVLQALDAEVLEAHACYFGGGTAIVLLNDEYRESNDIDFLISDRSGYRDLRQRILQAPGLSAILRQGLTLDLVRAVRSDQYGIRTFVRVGSDEIKFEIVHEGRIDLDVPGQGSTVCGVTHLSAVDQVATKLLANSDRWADDSVFSRDLIDLALLNPKATVFASGVQKASSAYGESPQRDLKKAILRMRERKGRLEECMSALQMTKTPKAYVWQRIRDLARKL